MPENASRWRWCLPIALMYNGVSSRTLLWLCSATLLVLETSRCWRLWLVKTSLTSGAWCRQTWSGSSSSVSQRETRTSGSCSSLRVQQRVAFSKRRLKIKTMSSNTTVSRSTSTLTSLLTGFPARSCLAAFAPPLTSSRTLSSTLSASTTRSPSCTWHRRQTCTQRAKTCSIGPPTRSCSAPTTPSTCSEPSNRTVLPISETPTLTTAKICPSMRLSNGLTPWSCNSRRRRRSWLNESKA